MKLIFAVLTLAALAAFSFAGPIDKPNGPPTTLDSIHLDASIKSPTVQAATGPSAWSLNVVYDFKAKRWDAVALNDLRELTIHGKGTAVFLSAFAGTTTDKDGKAVAGMGFSHHRVLFDQVYVQSFAGIKVEAGVPLGPVVGFGFSYRFP